MKSLTQIISKRTGFSFILFLIISQISFAQDVSTKEQQIMQMDAFIQSNAMLLLDFNESEVLLEYNSLEIKELDFEDYLRLRKFSTLQDLIHQKEHSHDEIPSKILDCNNLGFENSAFAPGWSGGFGTYTQPFNNTTIVSNGINATASDALSRHTILTTPPTQNNPLTGPIVGYDTYAVNPTTGLADIPFLPTGGGNVSARLGNYNAGAEKERLTYQIEVTGADTLFHYEFALFMQDAGGHTANVAPYFSVTLKDSNGMTLTNPSSYFVDGTMIPADTTFILTTAYSYRKWKSYNLNLSSYIGQTITLEFEVSDCGLSGHSAYAYVNAGCGISGNFLIQQCYNGGTTTLEGPVGQNNYQWYGPNNSSLAIAGATNSTYTVNGPVNGDIYSLAFSEPSSTQTLYQNVQITPDSMSVSGNANISFCENNTDATLIAASGNSNYQWYDQNVNAISGATNTSLMINSPVIGDTFYVSFNEDGCLKWQSIAVIPQPYAITQMDIAGSCDGNSIGSLLVTTVSPLTTLSYVLNPGNILDFNGDFQFLPPGSYQLTITDPTNTCTSSIDTTIIIPTLVQGIAGTGDTIIICKNAPFDLFTALTGYTDSTGSWSGPFTGQLTNGSMPPNIVTSAGDLQYTYMVTDSICPTSSANVVVQVLNNCSFGLEEFINLDNVYIYPNPSLESFFITFGESAKPENYTIVDALGREVKTGKINENQAEIKIDMNEESVGEYTIRFYKNNELLGAKKMVKL